MEIAFDHEAATPEGRRAFTALGKMLIGHFCVIEVTASTPFGCVPLRVIPPRDSVNGPALEVVDTRLDAACSGRLTIITLNTIKSVRIH